MEELTCLEALKKMRSVYGTSEFDRAVKTLMRERLENPGREKRKRISPRLREKLYVRQAGKCAICGDHFPPTELEGDHINPNRQDFNAPSNWQLLCKSCNTRKNAKSVMEQTVAYGKTALEILGTGEEP